jgi:hypothetical protein
MPVCRASPRTWVGRLVFAALAGRDLAPLRPTEAGRQMEMRRYSIWLVKTARTTGGHCARAHRFALLPAHVGQNYP